MGNAEPFDETLRYYFSSNWNPAKTNSVTPIFLSPHGLNSQVANLDEGISEADINSKMADGLILFQSTESITPDNASNAYRFIETVVKVIMYGRSKYELFLFIEHINDIIQDNMPKTSFRIKKSDGIQDSAISSFKQRKGIKFSEPLIQDKDGHVFVSTGNLSCRHIKTKIS